MKFLFVIVVSFLFHQQAISQTKLDTISIFYPIPTYDTANDDPNHLYYSNGKRVDKKTGEANQIASELINKCKPCVLKTYGPNGILSESLQYGDGRIGYWIEFYPKSGRKKIIGQYMYFSSAEIREYCCKEIGKWEYYNSDGKLIKTESYSNGKLIKSRKF